MHFTPLENDPHGIPIKGFVMRTNGITPDPADCFVHARLGRQVRVNLEHAGGSMLQQAHKAGQVQPAGRRLYVLETSRGYHEGGFLQENLTFVEKWHKIPRFKSLGGSSPDHAEDSWPPRGENTKLEC